MAEILHYGQALVLFHNDFYPSGEQPKQRLLAHKL